MCMAKGRAFEPSGSEIGYGRVLSDLESNMVLIFEALLKFMQTK